MSNFEPYSKRLEKPKDAFIYTFEKRVRNRIYQTIQDLTKDKHNHYRETAFQYILNRAGIEAMKCYGQFADGSTHVSLPKTAEHFFACDDLQVLDFLEFLFRADIDIIFVEDVSPINHIFQTEAIGYELTQFREVDGFKQDRYGGIYPGKVLAYPQIIQKDGEYIHNEVIRPCLEALSRPGFEVPLSEMMKAHRVYRDGHYADVITDVGSAFESVMKVICTKKGWPYDPSTDTCSKLVKACKDGGLFDTFYVPMFEAVGTVRNKLGDAHGKGPAPQFEALKEHADHMLQMTSAHISFLIKLSGL